MQTPVRVCEPFGPSSIPEYEQRARVERTKIAKLRVLRLAREAELAPKPEETGGATVKPASLSSAITHHGTVL
jgi:hypothetical protein